MRLCTSINISFSSSVSMNLEDIIHDTVVYDQAIVVKLSMHAMKK